MVDATAGHDLEFGRGCRDGKAAARIAAHMRQVEMGGVELSALTSRLYRLPSPSVTVTVHHFPTWI